MSTIPVRQVARAIHGEYLEMPGLSLTREQVQRLYSLDALTSESILAALVDLQFLAKTGAGRYVRTGAIGGTLGRRRRPQSRAA